LEDIANVAESKDEIEITPEMVEAGRAAFYAHDPLVMDEEEIFTLVYLAMCAAKTPA
jgi:hypothetical protein